MNVEKTQIEKTRIWKKFIGFNSQLQKNFAKSKKFTNSVKSRKNKKKKITNYTKKNPDLKLPKTVSGSFWNWERNNPSRCSVGQTIRIGGVRLLPHMRVLKRQIGIGIQRGDVLFSVVRTSTMEHACPPRPCFALLCFNFLCVLKNSSGF